MKERLLFFVVLCVEGSGFALLFVADWKIGLGSMLITWAHTYAASISRGIREDDERA